MIEAITLLIEHIFNKCFIQRISIINNIIIKICSLMPSSVEFNVILSTSEAAWIESIWFLELAVHLAICQFLEPVHYADVAARRALHSEVNQHSSPECWSDPIHQYTRTFMRSWWRVFWRIIGILGTHANSSSDFATSHIMHRSQYMP